jgi:hypothetical protein
MLEAIPKNFFSTRFQFQQDNQLLGKIDNSIWREEARVELKDGTYLLSREGRFSGYFLIEHNGRLVARASKPSALRNTFEVEVAGRLLVLRQLSIWKRRFGLFVGDKQIGSIYPLRFLSRHAHIDVPGDLPLPIRVFLFWLVFIVWKRQSQAAA